MLTERFIGRPRSLLAAQAKILLPVALGSAFLNNTPIVAMFIPVIRDLARAFRLDATRLYIPLSYASILGGTCTLIGTATNLVVAGMVRDYLSQSAGCNRICAQNWHVRYQLYWCAHYFGRYCLHHADQPVIVARSPENGHYR